MSTNDVDAAVKSVMNLIVPNYWVAAGPDLYSGQRVSVDIVVLDQTATFSEYVYSTLVSVIDLVLSVKPQFSRSLSSF